jgi:hypothetical protein
MRILARISAAVVALLMMGTACNSNSPAAAPSGSPAASSPAKSTKYDPTRWREFGMTSEEYADHIQKVQAYLVECMAKAGFKYYPATVEQIEDAQDHVRLDLPKYPRVEYKKRWGYGATTRFDNRVKEVELGSQNLKNIEALSEADREAYERNMWGEDPEETFAWAFDEEDFSSTGGCTRKAVEANFTKDQIQGTYVNPKDVAVDQDPRVIKAVAEWKACMEAKGYEGYEDQDEIIEEFEKRLDELVGDEDPEELTGAKLQRLKALQQEEIKASLADVDCEIKHTDKVFQAVEIEIFGRRVSGTIRS